MEKHRIKLGKKSILCILKVTCTSLTSSRHRRVFSVGKTDKKVAKERSLKLNIANKAKGHP